MKKKLILMVEGEGDVQAVPVLVDRLLKGAKGWDCLESCDRSMHIRLGGLHSVVKDEFSFWKRMLQLTAKQQNVGAVLVVLDGDQKYMIPQKKVPYCAKTTASKLTEIARKSCGFGLTTSLAVVFAEREYESWLIAGAGSLIDKKMPDGRPVLKRDAQIASHGSDFTARDAKGWLNRNMVNGYRETTDQKELTRLVDLDEIRRRQIRSFRRLENAVSQLIEANRSGTHICTPA
jgi:hypothetical protein